MSVMRKVLLARSTNAWLRERATKAAFVRRSVRRFWPGERVEDALAAARDLQPQGINTILTRARGEPHHAEEAEEVTQHYLDVLDKVAASGLDAHISVKPTQLGLDLDRGDVRAQSRSPARAGRAAQQLPVDRHGVLAATSIRRWSCSAASGRSRRASASRCRPTSIARRKTSKRYCRSARPSASSRAPTSSRRTSRIPRRADVDENFYRLCVRLMSPEAQRAGALLHIATHDVPLAERLEAYAREHSVPASAYEFAMLYGIDVGHQRRLAAEGKRLRVLISYGEYWFPWYMRRLAERPANVWFVMKNMFG